MKKYILCIFTYILILPFISKADIQLAKIKASWEEKEGFFYLNLGSADGLKEGSIIVGKDDKKQPFYIEIVGIVGPHSSLFQQIDFIWDAKGGKILTNYLDKPNLNNSIKIEEIYDNLNLLLMNKVREVELLYEKAKENLERKRFHLAQKYFEDCLKIISRYKDIEEKRKEIINILAIYRIQHEDKKIELEKEINQVNRLKSEGDFTNALSVLQKLVAENPTNVKIRYELGRLYNEMGYLFRNDDYFQDAISELEELLFIDSSNNTAKRELAFFYYYKGYKDKAIERLQELVSHSNEESSAKLLEINNTQNKTICSMCLDPISSRGNQIYNGYIICAECNDSQIRNKQDFKSYFQTIENFISTKYRMKIRRVKDFLPNNEDEMKKILNKTENNDIQMVYFRSVYTEYEINYLNSLPRVLTIEGLAGEYARVWLEEQNLSCITSQIEEGFKMFFKYVILNHFRCEKQAEKFIYQNDSISFNFRRIKTIVENKGEDKLAEEARKCFE